MQSPAFWPGFFANASAIGPQATVRKKSPLEGELPPRFVKRTGID